MRRHSQQGHLSIHAKDESRPIFHCWLCRFALLRVQPNLCRHSQVNLKDRRNDHLSISALAWRCEDFALPGTIPSSELWLVKGRPCPAVFQYRLFRQLFRHVPLRNFPHLPDFQGLEDAFIWHVSGVGSIRMLAYLRPGTLYRDELHSRRSPALEQLCPQTFLPVPYRATLPPSGSEHLELGTSTQRVLQPTSRQQAL